MPTRNINCAILFPMRNDFGIWLQQQREAKNVSQSKLAKLAGINRAILSKLENGIGEPRPDTLIAIAKGLDIPRETIFQAIGWLEDAKSNQKLDEGKYLLGLLGERDLEEIIKITKIKLDAEEISRKQTSREKTRLEMR